MSSFRRFAKKNDLDETLYTGHIVKNAMEVDWSDPPSTDVEQEDIRRNIHNAKVEIASLQRFIEEETARLQKFIEEEAAHEYSPGTRLPPGNMTPEQGVANAKRHMERELAAAKRDMERERL